MYANNAKRVIGEVSIFFSVMLQRRNGKGIICILWDVMGGSCATIPC